MADLDLNLLVVLDALLTEGSVTGAAERLHLSVPATSRALGRLRRTLDNEVLVRAGRVMVPTPGRRRPARRCAGSNALAACSATPAAIAGPLSPLHHSETAGETTGEVTLERLAAPRDLPPRPHRSPRSARCSPSGGLSRDVMAVVPTPTAALNRVLVCLTTSGFAARVTGVRLLPVPAELPLRPMAQAWHPRFAEDPGRRWLRARVRDAAPTG